MIPVDLDVLEMDKAMEGDNKQVEDLKSATVDMEGENAANSVIRTDEIELLSASNEFFPTQVANVLVSDEGESLHDIQHQDNDEVATIIYNLDNNTAHNFYCGPQGQQC